MKEIIVSGGSKGIGSAIVNKYLSNQFKVIVLSRSRPKLKNTNLIWYKTDVTNEREVTYIMNIVLKKYQNIEILINNVGKSEWKPITKINKSFLDNMFYTNIYSCLFLTKKIVPYFRKRKFGNIINISSLAGKRGTANNSIYCATKFGMNGITQALSKELGCFNIRVNGVCPVLINTPGLSQAMNKNDSPLYNNKNFYNKFIKEETALKKLPTAEDVSDLVFFLTCKESSSITGQSINVDCGVLPQ